MQNYAETLLSQYANSPTLCSLLESFNDAIDPATDIQAFYSNIWSINSAVGYGLDVWGQIVGVSRNLQVTTSDVYFGFAEQLDATIGATNPTPFNNAPFYGGSQKTSTYTLGDVQYRTLIIAKAMTNITNLTAPSMNALIAYVFSLSGGVGGILGQDVLPFTLFNSSQQIYVREMGAMAIEIVFIAVAPTPLQLAVILNSGVFPRPAGVSLTVVTS